MCKRLIFLISFVLVLSLGVSVSAQPFETAVAVWNLADETDENGPPFTDLETDYFYSGGPVAVTGAEGAEHWDGWALPSTSTSTDGGASYTELDPPLGDELRIEGAVSILVRVKMAGWVEDIEVVAGLYDGGCDDTVPSYGIEFQDFGHPTFAVSAAGTRERVEVSLPEAVELDTWYDILGIFDPCNTLSISVYDSATGSLVDSNTVTATFDALDYPDLPELEILCSPCLMFPQPEDFAYVELVAVWAEAVFITRGASNPRPANGAKRVSPDNLRLIWDKDPCAVSSNEDVYFSRIWADVNDGSAWKPPKQDANYWPTLGYLKDVCDIQLGETYYWAIDEVIAPDACAAPGPVWSFTIIDVYAENPSPKDDAEYVGPCPTLEWDPGYGVVTHKVYFDVNEAKVAGRVGDPCYEGGNTYYTPGELEWDTPYFWVVDEVNAGDVNAFGPVWSFTVGPNYVTDLPDWRGETDTFYANWAFDVNWLPGKLYPTDYGIVPANPDFDPNCVDPPYAWLATHLGRSGIADNNGPAGEAGENSIILKHNDYATPGQSVTIRVALIWSGESSPSVSLERLIGWGAGIDPEGGWDAWEETDPYMNGSDPAPLYSFELCDGWTYSVYEVEFELVDPADNIHININTDGEFYLDSVVVDAHWYHPPEAHGPKPVDEEEGVYPDLCTLGWYPGSDVALAPDGGHDVYFGTDWDDVNDANANDPVGVIYQGRQDANFYPDAGCLSPLTLDQTYFWRVDEVNDNDPCMWRGDVWSFTTRAWDLIDDFELYTSTGKLQNVWQDGTSKYNGNTKGNAAAVVLVYDPAPFMSPIQSMKYTYDWPGAQAPKYCVVWQTFDSPQDWTERGATLLVLWFNGDANELSTPFGVDPCCADGMSVTLADDDNADGTIDDSWTIEYAGDVGDLIAQEWMSWALPLQDFNEAGNVNPNKIKQMEIRIIGGSMGQIFFDDVRLYAPACVPELAPDITGDCNWNEEDLAVMTEDWLDKDYYIYVVPEEPCDANLILWYTFDPCVAYGGLYDYSGNAYHGIAVNDINVHDGILTLKNAMADPAGEQPADMNAVEIGGDFNSLDVFTNPYSVMVEYRVDACQPDLDMIIMAASHYGEDDGKMTLYIGYVAFEYYCGGPFYGLASDHVGFGGVGKDAPGLIDGNWHRMVFTYDPVNVDPVSGFHHGAYTDVYDPNILDIWDTGAFTNDDMPTGPDWRTLIGATITNTDVWSQEVQLLSGDVNEVRIYDYALTPAQVQAIAAVPPVPLEVKHFVDPVINLYEDGDPEVIDGDTIDFKDFGVIANKWLEVELY